jgi:hypothetical protein
MDFLLDFSNIEQKNIGVAEVNYKKRYERDYGETTCGRYRSHRINKTDPITFENIDVNSAFKFPYIWNSLTGERLGTDPYGPLYFNPLTLLQYFYSTRLNSLWIDSGDGYEGYYGDAMGAGEDIEIPCRGIYPERYVFRLPIQDCYLKKDHNLSIVTMGPKLIDREICELDRLLEKHWSRNPLYCKIYPKIGSLFKMKCYYDVSVSKEPLKLDLSGIELGQRDVILKNTEPNRCLNIIAIEALKKMK